MYMHDDNGSNIIHFMLINVYTIKRINVLFLFLCLIQRSKLVILGKEWVRSEGALSDNGIGFNLWKTTLPIFHLDRIFRNLSLGLRGRALLDQHSGNMSYKDKIFWIICRILSWIYHFSEKKYQFSLEKRENHLSLEKREIFRIQLLSKFEKRESSRELGEGKMKTRKQEKIIFFFTISVFSLLYTCQRKFEKKMEFVRS